MVEQNTERFQIYSYQKHYDWIQLQAHYINSAFYFIFYETIWHNNIGTFKDITVNVTITIDI